ncbi:MAG TPA: hypothetical protein DCE56_09965 [Cyanobacteria bacterium UBA8553]|nr:hypothetical protein [Cyanobacteria bacterium UBA8553]HAJ63151.1 hypothetical protein [Cyanobacteria bacterium UBA8543]
MNVLRVVTAIGGTVLTALGVTMALTNPSPDTYEEYAVEQLSTYLKNEGCTQVPVILGDSLKRQCKTLVDKNRPQIEQLVAQTTQRQNFIVFSIYRTNLEVGSFLPVYRFETLGVFQQFYIYKAGRQ